jgi:hypothetical protein
MGPNSHTPAALSSRRGVAQGLQLILAAGGMVALSCALASAQSSMPAGSPGRFTMHPADGGVLRMDTQTGALSMCRQVTGSWSCTALPDDRTSMTTEIDRLKAENAELKSSVKRLEELAGVPAGADDGKSRPGTQLPTEEDVDKAMSYVQRMLKKFKEKLRELEDTDPPKRTQL